MESERSTSSRLPARIIMKSFCGECSQCGPNGQEPAHTPHCMHILTHSPSSTCASTSLRKLLVYRASACWLRSLTFARSSRKPLHWTHADFLDHLGVVVDQLRHARDVGDRDFVGCHALGLDRHLLQRVVDLAHAVGRKFGAFDEVALVIVAVLAAHQHHAVVAGVDGIGDPDRVDRTQASYRYRPDECAVHVALHAGHVQRRIRSEEHTSELQSQSNLVCRLLLEKKKYKWCSSAPPAIPTLGPHSPVMLIFP